MDWLSHLSSPIAGLPLTTSHPWTIAIALLITTLLIHEYRSWKRLSHIPGPFLNSISSLPHFIHCARANQVAYWQSLTKQYGPILRIAPNKILYTDPTIMRTINGARSPYTRGHGYDAVRAEPTKDNILSTRSDAFHKETRKKMTPGYSGKDTGTGGFDAPLDKAIAAFIDLVERKYISTDAEHRPMEMGAVAQYYTYDSIAQIAYGRPFGCLENDDDVLGLMKMIHSKGGVVVANLLFTVPAFRLHRIKDLFPRGSVERYGLGSLLTFAEKFVGSRFDDDDNGNPKDVEQHKDMAQSFIRHGIGREQLVQEVCFQAVAGSDTAATTLRFAILHLCASPPALRKVLGEIDAGVKGGKIGSPVTGVQAQGLGYLQAVLWETLRVCPPALNTFQREVPEGGDMLGGYCFLPAGTQVAQNIMGMMRDRRVWGENADVFLPERWLDIEDEERAAEMRAVAELVFGFGKWSCMGKGIALMELSKVLVELLRRYDFTIVNPVKPMNLVPISGWLTTDYWLRVTRREPSA